MSLSLPPVSMNAPITSAYMVIATWTSVTRVWRSATTCEIDTFMTVVSRTITNWAIPRMRIVVLFLISSLLDGRRRLRRRRGLGVLGDVLGEQVPLAIPLREPQEDDRRAEDDGDYASAVCPRVALKERRFGAGDDLRGVVGMLRSEIGGARERFRQLALDLVGDVVGRG